jgi:hypothetical protein
MTPGIQHTVANGSLKKENNSRLLVLVTKPVSRLGPTCLIASQSIYLDMSVGGSRQNSTIHTKVSTHTAFTPKTQSSHLAIRTANTRGVDF